jgi:subtilisin family serine protease
VNSAVARAVAKGVTVVVAAGNDNANACNYSPAREPSAITVGATTSGDTRASYSNFGSCVDIFAPGSNITSSWHTASNASSTISGTSMASPHVTGVAALVAQANPGASPATIAAYIASTATPNHVASAGAGSPNRLLYSLGTTVAAPPAVKTVAVKTLAGSSSLQGPRNRARSWQAQATVTVRDISSGAAVANATVTGSFSSGSTAGTCVTGSNGSCFISASGLSLTTAITVFTVTGISGSNMAYDAGANAAAQITINRP